MFCIFVLQSTLDSTDIDCHLRLLHINGHLRGLNSLGDVMREYFGFFADILKCLIRGWMGFLLGSGKTGLTSPRMDCACF